MLLLNIHCKQINPTSDVKKFIILFDDCYSTIII